MDCNRPNLSTVSALETETAPASFSAGQFREALGAFATGVTIVTTCDERNRPVGLTVSSFNSVSLSPPLVLWSIARTARSFEVFARAHFFAVHVLGENQQDLCDRFARRGTDKFESLQTALGLGGVPLLPDYSACFQCTVEHRYAGGDHQIIVGRVVALDQREAAPLIVHRGAVTPLRSN